MSVRGCTPYPTELAATSCLLLQARWAYLQIPILKQQPGILRVCPVGSRGPLAYKGLAQNALILMTSTLLIAPLQGHLGNAPEGLLPDGQGG